MQAKLQEVFMYKEGNLYWKIQTSNRIKIGDKAGMLGKTGYYYSSFNGKREYIHRLVYMYHNNSIPKGYIVDHINRNKLDNRIENLRLVTAQENTFNASNTKGYVYSRGRYTARLRVDNKTYYIGNYSTAELAEQAYLAVKAVAHTYGNEITVKEIKAAILKIKNRLPLNNTSGIKNVHKRPNGTWQARARKDGKYISLGHYSTKEEAHSAIVNYHKSDKPDGL